MQVNQFDFSLDKTLTPLFSATSARPARSTGTHGSEIWNDLEASLAGKRDPIEQETLRDYGAIGFLWERVLESHLARLTLDGGDGRWMCPGELELDDIFLTPDQVDLDFHGDGTMVLGLEEWKCTWRSVNKADNLERWFWKWLVQQKAYCKALDTIHSRLRGLFIVGDWAGKAYPQTRGWEFTWTQRELDDNWSMLRNHGLAKGWLVQPERTPARGNRKTK